MIIAVSLTGAARAEAPEEPVSIKMMGANATPPKAIRQRAPVYPDGMRRAGLGGLVLVEFIITTKGEVLNPKVIRSNNPWFERPALDAIQDWKFSPGTIDGKPVNVLAEQQLEFRTADGNGAVGGIWEVGQMKDKERAALPPELQWDQAPVPQATAYPVYPLAALQARKEGSASIKFLIDRTGKVSAAQVITATTPEMGQSVLAMIDAWEFTPPAKKDGTPCSALLTMSHNFRTSGHGDVPVSSEARNILRHLEKSPAKIVPGDKLDRPIKPISTRPPVYPTALRNARTPGEALIEFFIDERGDAQLPAVISCTAPEFGYAAVQAVATWRFEPPVVGAKPVVTRARVPLKFDFKN